MPARHATILLCLSVFAISCGRIGFEDALPDDDSSFLGPLEPGSGGGLQPETDSPGAIDTAMDSTVAPETDSAGLGADSVMAPGMDSATHSDTNSSSDPVLDATTDSFAGVDSDTGGETDALPDSSSIFDTGSESAGAGDSGALVDTETVFSTDVATDTDSDSLLSFDSDTHTDTGSGTGTEINTGTDTDIDTGTDTDTGVIYDANTIVATRVPIPIREDSLYTGRTDNPLGVQGFWYEYGDEDSTIAIFNAVSNTVCVSGSLNGAPDWLFFYVGFGFFVCQEFNPTASHPLGACPWSPNLMDRVIGVSFEMTGTYPENGELELLFAGASGSAPIPSLGRHDVLFTDAIPADTDGTVIPENTSRIQFQLDNTHDIVIPFDFCIGNVAFLLSPL